jgi:hypothetical protein
MIVMDETPRYTLEQAHLQFAKSINGQVWDLLGKPDRSPSDDERMIHAAHASLYHWLNAGGTGLHHQRGEWLLAHVYTVLALAEPALRHALRCQELTYEFADLMQDFDRAYANEGLARAHALAGNRSSALEYLKLAQASGAAIQNDEDRDIFMGDFNSGDWHGLK